MTPERLDELFTGDWIPVIMGPTASGKSALALQVAERFNGEIICADSMQFYRGLDIGTAKASPEEQKRIPHHLLDSLDISEKSDIFRFRDQAETCIADIRARGKRPVIEGGSGLYLRALCYGLDDLPARQDLRDELDLKFDNAEHFPELCAIMQKSCPDDFMRFSQHRRKLIRAYEVYLLSGRQITELQQAARRKAPCKDFHEFVLIWERDALKERIRQRVGVMLNAGWIEEARTLIGQGLLEMPTAWQALGYSLIADCLAGKIDRAELEVKIAQTTWQFARRQITWFKHQHPNAQIIPMPQ